MRRSMKIALFAALLGGFATLASGSASAMPLANNVGLAPATDEAHAVRVCNRYRCWYSHAGHYHGRYGYGWRRPYYGHYRYGYGPHYRGHGRYWR